MEKLTTNPTAVKRAVDSALALAREKPLEEQDPRVIESLQNASQEASNAPLDKVFVARNPAGGQIQAAMAVRESRLDSTPALEPLEAFSDSDPGWAEVALAVVDTLFRGKATFPNHAALTDFQFTMADDARVALFSDWGTGQPVAIRIAKLIEAQSPHHLIHLGDIYYAGEEDEAEDRFLRRLPRAPSILSRFALNGNHEMFSGGRGYFEKVLPVFQQPASYFSITNRFWRIIGLDTAYDDKKYHGNQIAWLRAQLQDDGRKNILLTHHQAFSIYESDDVDGKVLEDVKDLLDAGRIHVWFWGHEHKHIIYRKHHNVLARCIGHGAIPYLSPPLHLPVSDIPVQFINRRVVDGVHCANGFAMLNFNEERAHVQYVNDDGFVPFEENLEFEIADQVERASAGH